MQKTKGDTFDLRAEEDAARRLNVGKSFTVSSSMTGLKSRAKRTDMMSKSALRERAEAVAKDHGMTIDRESQLYLMAAIETRLRSLLASSLSAQTHRVNANHLRAPPVDKRSGKGIWSHEIVSDTSGVLDSLNRLNREEEQEFRKSRMTRLAREAEMQRIRERERERAESMGIATPAASNSDLEVGLDTTSNGFGPAAGSGAGPSTPMPMSKTSSSHSPYPANSFSTPQAPMFGAVKESKNNTPGSSMTKKAMKKMNNPRDVSAEVQHKMANATAMRSVGMGKKYGWMTGSAPAISSPLATAGSKKRKAGAEGKGGSGAGGGALFGGSKLKDSTLFAGANGSEKEKEREKDKTEPSTPQTPGAASAGTPEGDRPSKKMRHAISAPTRRLISVERPPPKKGASAAELEEYTKDKDKEIRIEDDKVITMVDLTFALEHGGLGGGGRGSGKGREDDVLQRIWGRPGGPWGKDGWDGRR